MANKGANTQVLEAKKKILDTVNEILNEGIPLSIVSMIIDEFKNEINVNLNIALKKEKEIYEKEIKKEKDN